MSLWFLLSVGFLLKNPDLSKSTRRQDHIALVVSFFGGGFAPFIFCSSTRKQQKQLKVVVLQSISETMSVHCQASCVMLSQQTAASSVIGSLLLKQEGDVVKITGTLSNLSPGKHGLSIGVAGDLSQGAASCGTTFNPFGRFMYTCIYCCGYTL